MGRRSLALAIAIVCLAAAVVDRPAGADTPADSHQDPKSAPYVRWRLVDDRPMTGSDLRVHTTVRFALPATWRHQRGSAARIRFRTGSYGCTLVVTFSDRVAAGRAEPAATRLARMLPERSARHVLDQGTRGSGAWRVVRQTGAAMIGRFAVRTPQVEKRLDTSAPEAPEAVWHEVDAVVVPSGECHAGHYRVASARIGDALAALERSAVPQPG